MNTEREARRDAREWARAQMYYGEGAGTRRKLITATVEAKANRDPAYSRTFQRELSRQDMAEHAAKARRERRRKDATETVTKTTKNVVTGNYQNLQAGVMVVAGVVYVMHQTGLDKMVLEKGRALKHKVQLKFKNRNKRTFEDVHVVTNMRNNNH